MKRFFISLIIVIMFSSYLTSCATMNEGECKKANWYKTGYHDGQQGRKVSYADKRDKDCSQYGVVFDYNEYHKGRNLGLESYCKPDNGYHLGLEGKYYNKVCPLEAEGRFLYQYNIGKSIHTKEGAINDINRKLDNARSNYSKEKDSNKRRAIKSEITSFERHKRELKQEIKELRRQRHW